MNQKTFRIIKKQGIHHKQLDGYQHALFYRALNVVLLILGACNLAIPIKEMCRDVWKKNMNS